MRAIGGVGDYEGVGCLDRGVAGGDCKWLGNGGRHSLVILIHPHHFFAVVFCVAAGFTLGGMVLLLSVVSLALLSALPLSSWTTSSSEIKMAGGGHVRGALSNMVPFGPLVPPMSP